MEDLVVLLGVRSESATKSRF